MVRRPPQEWQTGRSYPASPGPVLIIIIAIRDFDNLSREPSPTCTLKWPGRNHVKITCNASSAYHVQHVVLRATWYEGTAQLFKFEFKSHLFELYFIGWTINRWRRGGSRSTRSSPLATSYDLQLGPLVAALLYRVRARTGWPCISIFWLGERANLGLWLLSQCGSTYKHPSLRYTSILLGR